MEEWLQWEEWEETDKVTSKWTNKEISQNISVGVFKQISKGILRKTRSNFRWNCDENLQRNYYINAGTTQVLSKEFQKHWLKEFLREILKGFPKGLLKKLSTNFLSLKIELLSKQQRKFPKCFQKIKKIYLNFRTKCWRSNASHSLKKKNSLENKIAAMLLKLVRSFFWDFSRGSCEEPPGVHAEITSAGMFIIILLQFFLVFLQELNLEIHKKFVLDSSRSSLEFHFFF